MKYFAGIHELKDSLPFPVVTIGNFDGLHLGHQEIFYRVLSHAKRENGTAVVVTFKPHPQMALAPVEKPRLLNTYQEKAELFRHFGVDVMIEEPFSRTFSNTSPDAFVNKYLLKELGAKVLYLGYDFAFGKGRTGTVETLKPLAVARGMELHVVPPQLVDGEPVSSSRVRNALDSGNDEEVRQCLGRAFFFGGNLIRGEGRGHKIGFPTANVALEYRKLPRRGVHITSTVWRGKAYPSITNVGLNPTFTNKLEELSIETHLLSFEEDLYGDELEVQFHSYLREEKKFSGVEELVVQIKTDVEKAHSWHAARS